MKENNTHINSEDVASLSKEERMKLILELAKKSMDEHENLYSKLAQ